MGFFYLISRPIFAFLFINITTACENYNAGAAAKDVIATSMLTANVPVADMLAAGVPEVETFLSNIF